MKADDGRVVSNFIVQALKGIPLTIYGSGMQTRSFCYVDDLVPALLGLMDQPSGLTGPMNLGNPTEFTMTELAQAIIALTGSRSEIVFKELPEDDPKQRQPNISFAQEQLGWNPTVPLQVGLERTVDYFRAII